MTPFNPNRPRPPGLGQPASQLGLGAPMQRPSQMDPALLAQKRAQAAQVTAQQDAVGINLRGEVPVADVPGQRDEVLRIARANLHQLLWCCDDLRHAAIFQHQPVALFEVNGLLEVDENILATGQRDALAPHVAFVRIQHHDAEGFLSQRLRTAEGCGAQGHQ